MDNELDAFLGGLKEPEKDPFKVDEVFPTEEQPKEEKEEKVPFHKDPKLQKYIEKEISKRVASIEPKTIEKSEAPKDEDDYYVRLIGNDTPEKVAMIREAKQREERQLQLAEERALSRLAEQEAKGREAEQKATEELDNYFEAIEETYGVDLNAKGSAQLRSEFLELVKQVSPKNKDGDVVDFPDLEQLFGVFQKMQDKPNRAKEIASRSMARSSDVSNVKETKEVSWGVVDKLFGKLNS